MSKEAPQAAPREAQGAAQSAPKGPELKIPTSKPTLEDRTINVLSHPGATVLGAGLAAGTLGVGGAAAMGADIPGIVQESPKFVEKAMDQMGMVVKQSWDSAETLARMKKANPGTAEAAAELVRVADVTPETAIKQNGTNDVAVIVKRPNGLRFIGTNPSVGSNGNIDLQGEAVTTSFNPVAVAESGTKKVIIGSTNIKYTDANGQWQETTNTRTQRDVVVNETTGVATIAVQTSDGKVHVDTLNTTTGALTDTQTGVTLGSATSIVAIESLSNPTTAGGSEIVRGITPDGSGYIKFTRDTGGNVTAQQLNTSEGIGRVQMEFDNQNWHVNRDTKGTGSNDPAFDVATVIVNVDDVKSNSRTFQPDTSRYPSKSVSVDALAKSTSRGEAYVATSIFALENGAVVTRPYIERVSLTNPADNTTHALLNKNGLPTNGTISSMQAVDTASGTLLIAEVGGVLYGKNVSTDGNFQQVGIMVPSADVNYRVVIPRAIKASGL